MNCSPFRWRKSRAYEPPAFPRDEGESQDDANQDGFEQGWGAAPAGDIAHGFGDDDTDRRRSGEGQEKAKKADKADQADGETADA